MTSFSALVETKLDFSIFDYHGAAESVDAAKYLPVVLIGLAAVGVGTGIPASIITKLVSNKLLWFFSSLIPETDAAPSKRINWEYFIFCF